MEIRRTEEANKLDLALEGRMDTTTAPQLEKVISSIGEEVTELSLDFEKLEYLSSAGLRVILAAQKKMNRQGKMTICHVNETIMDIFEITGFAEILNII